MENFMIMKVSKGNRELSPENFGTEADAQKEAMLKSKADPEAVFFTVEKVTAITDSISMKAGTIATLGKRQAEV